MRDFFVSYNGNDKAWAEWIAWTLEEAGYTVVIQAWDFRPGENFVLKMQEAFSGCEKTIAVLSENYLNALYTKPEWAAAFVDDPTGVDRKLVPIRVEECKLEGLLKPLIYIDLVGLSQEDAKLALLGAFSARAKPEEAPEFPVTEPKAAVRVTPTRKQFPVEVSAEPTHYAKDLLAASSTATRDATPPTARERLELIKLLSSIVPQHFNMLVYAVNPPPGLIPPMPAPQADRAVALLKWAEAPGGCGYDKVNTILQAILKSAPASTPVSNGIHEPVSFSSWQMIAIFAFCVVAGIIAFSTNYILAFILYSLATAVITFGVLDSTAYVENRWGKFGSAAAIFVATLLICLGFFKPESPRGTDISGIVYVNGETAKAGKVVLIGTTHSENEYQFKADNPGYFEFNSVPDIKNNMATLEITVQQPFADTYKPTEYAFTDQPLKIELEYIGRKRPPDDLEKVIVNAVAKALANDSFDETSALLKDSSKAVRLTLDRDSSNNFLAREYKVIVNDKKYTVTVTFDGETGALAKLFVDEEVAIQGKIRDVKKMGSNAAKIEFGECRVIKSD